MPVCPPGITDAGLARIGTCDFVDRAVPMRRLPRRISTVRARMKNTVVVPVVRFVDGHRLEQTGFLSCCRSR